jgi:hypothetical protein
MMATGLGHSAYKSLRHFWHPEYIVRSIAALLVLLGIYFFDQGMNGTRKFATSFAPNFATDCFSLAVAILVIDQLYRWRNKVYQQRIDESLAAQRKRNIIQQMASRSNDFSLDAVRIASNEGWLKDGSLQGANLHTANLQGAILAANLRGNNLAKANFQGATLVWAEYDLRTVWPEGFDYVTTETILVDKNEPNSRQ